MRNIFLAIGIFFMLSTSAFAGSAKLEWNQNPVGEKTTGYNIYPRQEGQDVGKPFTVLVFDLEDPENPTVTLSGFLPGIWNFSLTAFNAGSESLPTKEIKVEIVVDSTTPVGLTGTQVPDDN